MTLEVLPTLKASSQKASLVVVPQFPRALGWVVVPDLQEVRPKLLVGTQREEVLGEDLSKHLVREILHVRHPRLQL